MNAPAFNINNTERSQSNNSLDIALLDDNIGIDDSRDSILNLLNHLQNYHRRRNFSHWERFGKPDPWSEKMLAQLTDAHECAVKLIRQAKDNQTSLEIESSIRLKLLEDK